MDKYNLRIDADVICYKAGFSADSRNGGVANSLHNAKLLINQLKKRFQCDRPTLYLSSRDPKDNFRTQITDDYKKNRSKLCQHCKSIDEADNTVYVPMLEVCEGYKLKGDMRYRAYRCLTCGRDDIKDTKPYYYLQIRRYLINKFGAKICKWGEADDWLGTDVKPNTIIASIDKDLLMIPAMHWRMNREIGVKVKEPGELMMCVDKDGKKKLDGNGFLWFCAQLLMGDAVDNIQKPRKGMGDVAIYNYFESVRSPINAFNLAEQVHIAEGKQDLFELNCKLLWIARKRHQIFDRSIVEELEGQYNDKFNE